MRAKLSARYAIGFEDGDHVVIENGDVVSDDDRILFIGHGYSGHADAALDYGDAVVGRPLAESSDCNRRTDP